MALGAERRRVIAMVVQGAIRLVIIGVALGFTGGVVRVALDSIDAVRLDAHRPGDHHGAQPQG